MAVSNVQAQWSLDSTTHSALSVARGVVVAATSDNVQILAIVACERFGNTLAICPDTCHKVEAVILPTPQPAPLAFLRGVVGFSSNDCASQLGKSAAGVRFLGLASALITTLDPFVAANGLDMMLRKSTTDLTLIPTVRQLKDLLKSLQSRSYKCGFADDIVGWRTLLYNEALSRLSVPRTSHLTKHGKPSAADSLLDEAPSSEMIDRLTDTFRQLCRIGDSMATKATIKVRSAAPWIIAFTKWSLGIPPSIYIEDFGLLLEQRHSQVDLIVALKAYDNAEPFEITIQHGLLNLRDLTAPTSSESWQGMVSAESYGTWLLQMWRFDKEHTMEGYEALYDAVYYGIPLVVSWLHDKLPEHTMEPTNNSTHYSHLEPLANEHDIWKTFSRFLQASTDGLSGFAPLPRGMSIFELPRVAKYIEASARYCDCPARSCRGSSGPGPKPKECVKKDIFLEHVSYLILDILAYSLFESPSLEPVLVTLRCDQAAVNKVGDAILTFFRTRKWEHSARSMFHIVLHAKRMVGHIPAYGDKGPAPIVTSGNGQVIYPSLFNSYDIKKQGYGKLYHLRGYLRIEGEIYNRVDPDHWSGDHGALPETDLIIKSGVVMPSNLFPSLRLSWKINVHDNGLLSTALVLRSKAEYFAYLQINPLNVLDSLSGTLILDRCSHQSQSKLEITSQLCSYSTPWKPTEDVAGSHVNIVAVDGADDLRLLAIERAFVVSSAKVVLRGGACVACGVELCRRVKRNVLIL